MHRSLFNSIEQKTGVSMDEIFALANAIQHADFTSEKQVRKIVRRVAKISNRTITQELEDKLVQSIIQDGASLDFDKITRMMKQRMAYLLGKAACYDRVDKWWQADFGLKKGVTTLNNIVTPFH